MLGQPFGKVFPNEATAFHPSLPQRSRLASRVSPLGLGRTQAAERRSTAHADHWCRMESAHALDIRTACRSRLQPRQRSNVSRGNVQPWPKLHEFVFLRQMQWTRPCPTYYDSAACHRQRIQVAMLCAECDGGQYANDQGTAVGGCAGCLPCFEDGCSRHHLPAEKCERRCSSTDASTWQDGLVAILRNALCKDTGRKYRPLFSLLLFSLAK